MSPWCWPASTCSPRSTRLRSSATDVVRGFAALRWPARVEVIGQIPGWWSMAPTTWPPPTALAEALRTCFPPSRRTLVFGTTRDKDLHGQLNVLLPCFDTIIATRYVENPRSVPPEAIADYILELTGTPIRVVAEPAGAIALARELTDPNGLICVTGSLFLAAEARAIVLEHERSPSLTRVVT